MVLDVRNNSGGNGLNLFEIAGRFADYEQPVIQSQTRNGPGHTDFTDLETWSLRPQGPFQYTRPTVVLANQFSSSAAELFVLILRTYPHVTVIGWEYNRRGDECQYLSGIAQWMGLSHLYGSRAVIRRRAR